MEDDHKKSLLIAFLIIVVGIVYYATNNAFSQWAYSGQANPLLVILIYLFPADPIYLIVIWMFWRSKGNRGLVAAVLLTVALDILSLPHSIPSLFYGQVTSIPSDPNLAAYEDFQIMKWIASMSGGTVTFLDDIAVYIIIPAVLILIAVFLVTSDEFEDLVERV